MQQLATASSALPKDASALEASISALKSSISALERSIQTLEGSSGLWENVGWGCAIAVGLGIVGELVVIVCEYRDDRESWSRGIVCPPDHPVVWMFWFDILATIIVLAGVFGEAGASMKVASINSQLRSQTSLLRAKSDQLLSLVTQESGDAVVSVREANALAKSAREEAESFAKDIASAKQQAANAENDRAAALQRTADLEAQLSWRSVSPEQKDRIRKSLTALGMQFLPLKGLRINIGFLNSDPEGQEYADDIKSAIDGFGAEIPEPTGISMFGTTVPRGVIVSGNPKLNSRANWFLNLLNNSGIPVRGERNDNMDASTIGILVGVKPRPKKP